MRNMLILAAVVLAASSAAARAQMFGPLPCDQKIFVGFGTEASKDAVLSEGFDGVGTLTGIAQLVDWSRRCQRELSRVALLYSRTYDRRASYFQAVQKTGDYIFIANKFGRERMALLVTPETKALQYGEQPPTGVYRFVKWAPVTLNGFEATTALIEYAGALPQ